MSPKEEIPSIEESVRLDVNLPTVCERYFTHYYFVPKNQVVRKPNDSKQSDQEIEDGPRKKIKLDHSEITGDYMDVEEGENSTDKQSSGMKDIAMRDVMETELKIDDDASPTATSYVPTKKEYVLTGEETLVMVHSNKLCVVSLSPHHPILRNDLKVIKVEYEVFGVDRMSNKVSGKGKRGAQVMGSKATLCRLHTDTGRTYDVTCGARGKLVQVNEQLLGRPDLCRSAWGGDGFLGIVMPRLQEYESFIAALMPADTYASTWRQQQQQRTA